MSVTWTADDPREFWKLLAMASTLSPKCLVIVGAFEIFIRLGRGRLAKHAAGGEALYQTLKASMPSFLGFRRERRLVWILSKLSELFHTSAVIDEGFLAAHRAVAQHQSVKPSPLPELSRVLVRLDHVASRIVDAELEISAAAARICPK
jgi:hypothetical protein